MSDRKQESYMLRIKKAHSRPWWVQSWFQDLWCPVQWPQVCTQDFQLQNSQWPHAHSWWFQHGTLQYRSRSIWLLKNVYWYTQTAWKHTFNQHQFPSNQFTTIKFVSVSKRNSFHWENTDQSVILFIYPCIYWSIYPLASLYTNLLAYRPIVIFQISLFIFLLWLLILV